MAKRQDSSGVESEARQVESLDEINEDAKFSSAAEAINLILSYIALLGDVPDVINRNRRVVRWVALGTGSSKAAASAVLSMFDRELIGIRNRQFSNEFIIKNANFDNGLFHLCDTISRDALVAELKSALNTAGVPEDAPIMDMVQNDNYVTELSESAQGMGRNAANFPVQIASNLDDLEGIVNALTPACSVDAFIFIATGGGSATGSVPIIDGLFREGSLRPSSYSHDVYQVILQTEGRASDQEVETPRGEMTTTNTQQHQAVEILDGLRADDYIQNIFHVHRPLMAHAYTVQSHNLAKSDVVENIGEAVSQTNHDLINETVMGNRVINANRDNHVMNKQIRRLKCWENLMRVQSEPYELLSFDADTDRADIVDRVYNKNVLVPCMRSVASPEELENKNPDIEYPQTLEQSVEALTGLLPASRLAPAPTITGATVVIGVAGDSELAQSDIDTRIEGPAAEALNLDSSKVTGLVANNMTPVTIPGETSWLDGLMLLEVEDTVDTLGRL